MRSVGADMKCSELLKLQISAEALFEQIRVDCLGVEMEPAPAPGSGMLAKLSPARPVRSEPKSRTAVYCLIHGHNSLRNDSIAQRSNSEPGGGDKGVQLETPTLAARDTLHGDSTRRRSAKR